MLGRWVDGTIVSLTKRLMFQVLFFSQFLTNFFAKIVFYKFTKIKSFECPNSINGYEKNNTWNIRHLADELFVPLTQ